MENLKHVRPEDFDVEMLWQASREGRLMIAETVVTTDRETVKGYVRDYVHRITSLVTNPFRSSIDALTDYAFLGKYMARMETGTAVTANEILEVMNKYNIEIV